MSATSVIHVEHAGDGLGAVWAGCTLAVRWTGGGATNTWAYSADMGGPSASAYDVGVSIVDWINASGRPWYGAVTATLDALHDPTGASDVGGISITATATMDWTPGGNLRELTGLPATTLASTSYAGTAGAVGSVIPRVVRMVQRVHMAAPGQASRSGGWLVGPGYMTSRPDVTLVLTEAQMYAMVDALRLASAPRRVWAYEAQSSTWVQISVGRIAYHNPGPLHRGMVLEALG